MDLSLWMCQSEQERLLAGFQDLLDKGCTASNVGATNEVVSAIHKLGDDAKTTSNELPPSDASIPQIRASLGDDVAEEMEDIARSPRLSAWFCAMLAGQAPAECYIPLLTNAAARSLAKVLWSDARIVALDVSHLRLSDQTGAYLARALKNNKTLTKLEMDDNLFGAGTVEALAESLATNDTLQFLSLSSNMLFANGSAAPTAAGRGESCVGPLARSLAQNFGLTCLNLSRCGIGPEGGRLLCDAVANNRRLISVEVGYNHFTHGDVARMAERLEANRKTWRENRAREVERAKERERAERDARKEEEEKQKEEQNRPWLEEQRSSRAEERRQIEEEELHAKQKEEKARQSRERCRLREEERVQKAKSKKGKKGKKKGKK